MNNTLKTMLVAAAALSAVASQAQDKATLDLLVKKGVISAEERAKTLDEAAAARAASGVNRVFPKEDATKRFTIAGYFQTQLENFGYSQTVSGVSTSNYRSQNAFLMRRLYIEFIADVGQGIQGDVVFDMSGNTANSIDRAMVSHTSSLGTIDFGYKKVTWGYEESTLSSLFKASSSKLLTVERGITNRYWNEQENGSTNAALRSDGRRLGFGAHHTGIHYTSVANPQGFEYGASITAAAQGFNNYKGLNDLAGFANVVYNYKHSDDQKFAVGLNYGKTRYFNAANVSNTMASMEGYNPFIQAQFKDWTVYAEYLSTKIKGSADVANTNPGDHKPVGENLTVAYKINENWEAVARYTNLDTDGRGQQISDGVRDFGTVGGAGGAGISGSTFNKSNSYYLGVNYYFSLPVAGGATVAGPNAKLQLGYERSEFKDTINTSTGVITAGPKATVDAIRLQAQVAF